MTTPESGGGRTGDLPELLILADDFTGACDAAGPFAASRLTMVAVSGGDLSADVLALDLDVRERSDAEAELLAREATLRADGRVYVKVDSTLRGPVAGLIRGALAGSGKQVAVIAPAFPEHGRLFAGGRVVVNGVPGDSLIDLPGEWTEVVGASLARSTETVEQRVEEARARGAAHVVIDADDVECLRAVAAAWQAHPEWLVVGSGGLTRQLAAPVGPPHLRLDAGPVVVVAGSPHAVTRRQLANVPLAQDVVVLQTPRALERDNGQAAAALADDVQRLATRCRPRGVVLAGGTTARYVCQRLDVLAVRLVGELAAGIPVGYLQGGPWDGVAVVSKAGGFGAPDALLDAVRMLGPSSGT